MLKLNFNLYNGPTLLKDWWAQVKTHFGEVETAVNGLETALGEETTSRMAYEQNLEQRLGQLAAEGGQGGDSAMLGNLIAERNERKTADDILQANIEAEAASRETDDAYIRKRLVLLENDSHFHGNMLILAGISEDDVALWRMMCGAGDDYLRDLCMGFERDLIELYKAFGIDVYDGGIDGALQEDAELDGGGFDSTPSDSIDCGTSYRRNLSVA